MLARNRDPSVDVKRVKIIEVNLTSKRFPLALGRDANGSLYHINLSHGVGSYIVIPEIGDTWWIDRRIRNWKLLHREDEDEARNGSIKSWEPGDIKIISYATIPYGWHLCNGDAYSRTVYSALFDKIGVTYGSGNGTTTFNVPDVDQRFILGAGAQALASTGGAFDHIHNTNQSIGVQTGGTQVTSAGSTTTSNNPPYIVFNVVIKW